MGWRALLALGILGGLSYGQKVKVWGPYENAWGLSFSSDGSKWGFRYKEGGRWYVVINGEEWGPYEDTRELSFSSDGSKWGFRYYKKGGRCYVVIGED